MVYRLRSHACIHPDTYKYFLPKTDVGRVWSTLAVHYGDPVVTRSFGVMQIDSERLLLRAVVGGNPLTVIRKRGCKETDIEHLHRLIGFEDEHDCAA